MAPTNAQMISPFSPGSIRRDAAPHSLDAEQALLGGLLFDNDVLHRLPALAPEDFYDPTHGLLFGWIAARVAKGALADGVTLHRLAEQDEGLRAIGGAEYLADLHDKAAPGPLAVEYARLVQDCAGRRALIRLCADMAAQAAGAEAELPALLDESEAAIAALRPRDSARAALAHDIGALKTVDLVAAWAQGAAPGIATGLRDLDARCGGLHRGDLVILAGRPSMGKTSLCVNICHNVAMRGGKPSLGISVIACGKRQRERC